MQLFKDDDVVSEPASIIAETRILANDQKPEEKGYQLPATKAP